MDQPAGNGGGSAENLAERHQTLAFPTPIFTYVWKDMAEANAALKEEILQREAAGPGALRSNVGGWHSEPDLFRWGGSAVVAFGTRLNRFARDVIRTTTALEGGQRLAMKLEAWANVSRAGDYNGLHEHRSSHWSGVYYVSAAAQTPGDVNGGKLELVDPRVAINMLGPPGSMFEKRFLVDPRPGLMAFFPSWLKHMVHPFRGEGVRISIAYNIALQSAPKDEGKAGQPNTETAASSPPAAN
ncbi:MAG: TIGR02466 family protein [Pseudomonadota bacterium]